MYRFVTGNVKNRGILNMARTFIECYSSVPTSLIVFPSALKSYKPTCPNHYIILFNILNGVMFGSLVNGFYVKVT